MMLTKSAIVMMSCFILSMILGSIIKLCKLSDRFAEGLLGALDLLFFLP